MYFLPHFLYSIPKHIQTIGLRDSMNKQHTNGALPNGLLEIVPKKYNNFTYMELLTREGVFNFEQLTDLWAVDYPKFFKGHRFQVNYILTNLSLLARVRFSIYARPFEMIPTITDFYKNANWAEREVWNLYGVYFSNHPDLRNILTDYGFEGKPLRKEYPVVGYTQIRYDETLKRIVLEPVKLTQAYRTFNTKLNPQKT